MTTNRAGNPEVTAKLSLGKVAYESAAVSNAVELELRLETKPLGIVLAITYGTIVLLPLTLLAGLGALVLARGAGASAATT